MSKGDEPETPTKDEANVSEEVDTSVDDVEDEDNWDEDGVSFDGADDDEEAGESESSEESEEEPTGESEEDEPATKDDDKAQDTEESEESENETEESEDDSEQEEDTTSDESESQKEAARKAYKEREERRRLREAEAKLQQERDQREEENLKRYLDDAKDDEKELVKRQFEVQQHLIQKQRASLNQDKLDVGLQKFVAESELVRSKDPVVQEAFQDALDDFEAMYVVRDKDGNPLEVKADVYQYLQKKSGSFEKLTGIGARKQTTQKRIEKTRTVTRPTRTPKEPKADPDLDEFDKEFYG